MSFTENALKVLEARYLKRDENGNVIETPDGMLHRVADALGVNQGEKDRFYALMEQMRFLPNTPTLINAGKPDGQLSACFVLPVEDSMEGIFDAIKSAAIIHKTGGGTGFSFSRLRHNGASVASTGGEASGVVSFLRVFNEATNSVKQGGVRRGANMGLLRVDHPDIEEFIECKDDTSQLTNFNLSVGITDAFMEAVEMDADWDLIDPHTKEVVKTVRARTIWSMIVHQAWKNGEPGVIFLDEMNRRNPTPEYGEIECTNPCVYGYTKIMTPDGEVPIVDLCSRGTADIMAMDENGSFVVTPATDIRLTRRCAKTVTVETTGEELKCTPDHMVWLVDKGWTEAARLVQGDMIASFAGEPVEVISVTDDPGTEDVYDMFVPGYHNFVANGMVVHNCGEQPLLPYESCNLGSINLAKHVSSIGVEWDELKETVRTAVDFLNRVLDENHFPLPQIKENTLRTRKIGLGVMGWADMLLKLDVPYSSEEAAHLAESVMKCIQETAWERSRECSYGNATCTTIAPTGTISMLANVSSGIEPNFSWVYTRRSIDRELYVVHPLMEEELKKRGMFDETTLKKLHEGVPLTAIPGLEDLATVWELSQQIAPSRHIAMQSAFQKFTDNAVSKTINLPNSATENDVENIYLEAFRTKCKGVTVYRDGSRDSQVLNFEKKETTKPAAVTPDYHERPDTTYGTTTKTKIGCGKLYITVNANEHGDPIELFTNTGKYGGCPAQSEATARMVSLLLRYGVPVEDVAAQLKGIRCMNCVHRKDIGVLSCPDAIGKELMRFAGKQDEAAARPAEKVSFEEDVKPNSTRVCPECGAELELAEGCVVCKVCGYSKCG